MQHQLIKAFFFSTLPPGLSYELFDESGVQSAGFVGDNTNCIEMNVDVNPLVETEYTLQLKDSDGVIQNCKFSHSEGGIVIVENVDIDPKEPVVNKKLIANQKTVKRNMNRMT